MKNYSPYKGLHWLVTNYKTLLRKHYKTTTCTGSNKLYYTFFNNEVKFLSKETSWYESYKKTKEEPQVGWYSGNTLTYNPLRFKLLPKPLRRVPKDTYWVTTDAGQLLLHCYNYTPKLLTKVGNVTRSVYVNELCHGSEVLLYNEQKRYEVTHVRSVQLLKNFNCKSYLGNYVVHVPPNTHLLVNGFFVSG